MSSIPASTPVPKGKLSTAKYADHRERELRLLQEVAEDMKRDAEAEEARLVQAEKAFLAYIEELEGTYEDDTEGVAWFRLHYDEGLIELQQALAKAEADFKAEACKYAEEMNRLRGEIHAFDVKIEEIQKEQAKKKRKRAIETMQNILGAGNSR
ncbi:hypothetical protein RSOLAG22IIIB_08894 [Rhizoctonia solani]|uniref:Uncharacterized protein n=1 Tax=Rhizoctonia solani TaxID=456999 RepID=A0A0K6FW97_9AGAM|nr:hypothetical protein RSOLAG22IIIB_08894 [Rhizoctonia solani]